MEKDYRLLRPFDLEAAKRGDKICYNDESGYVTTLCGPDPKGNIAYQSNGMVYVAHTNSFKMAPLAWVEGKPVYKGDILYWKSVSNKWMNHVCDEFDVDKFLQRTGEEQGYIYANKLTWQKPKTKREGWVNIYRFNDTALFADKKTADKNAISDRIDCVRIEWEE